VCCVMPCGIPICQDLSLEDPLTIPFLILVLVNLFLPSLPQTPTITAFTYHTVSPSLCPYSPQDSQLAFWG
jgi:hypothetical protein